MQEFSRGYRYTVSYLWKTRNLVPANQNDGYPINIPLSMDWFKESLQETIDFPMKYGVFL